MGKHAQTKRALKTLRADRAAGHLRVVQREQARRITVLRISIVAVSILLVMAGYEVFKPTENAVIGSPGSNLIIGGLPDSESQISAALIQASAEPTVSAVFDYFNIDDISLSNLTKVQITPSDEQYSIVTLRANGHRAETTHSHANQVFYDSPFKDLLLRPDDSTVIYIGEVQQITDQSRTGMEGRTFAIHPQSGSILFNKTTDASVATRVFRNQPNLEPGGSATFFFEYAFSGAGYVREPEIEINFPEGLDPIHLKRDNFFDPEQTETGARLTTTELLSGNRTYWLEVTVTTQEEFLGQTLCPTSSVRTSTSSDVFSDTQCLTIADSSNTVASDCTRQTNGSYQLTGRYSELFDADCLEAFANSQQTTISRDTTSDQLSYTIDTINHGSNPASNIETLSLVDTLEYAGVAEIINGALRDQQAVWPQEEIAAGESAARKLRLSLRTPIDTTLPALTDNQSFDRVITLVSNTARHNTPLDSDFEADLAELSRHAMSVPPLVNFVALAAINGLLIVNYAHSVSVHRKARSKRRQLHGGMKI